MELLIATIAVLSVILVIIYVRRQSDRGQQVQEPFIERAPLSRNFEAFRIAGISQYCSRADIGPISGQTIDEPGNSHDKDAVMIVEAHGPKLLGYIARDDKPTYRSIAGNNERMPFIGYIDEFMNEDGEKCQFGVIRVYSGDDEMLTSDMQKEWDYLVAAFKITSYDKRMEALDEFKKGRNLIPPPDSFTLVHLRTGRTP